MTPTHIGIIMDGNGRWATAHGLKRSEGYSYGLDALLKVCGAFEKRGVKAVTAFAFSTENQCRPEEEKAAVFKVVEKFNRTYDGDMRIVYMGDIDSLPESLVESIELVERKTVDNKGMILNVALAYGARQDILHAAKRAYDRGEFTEEYFESALSSATLPGLDLIVRTGGEMRLSNFMLYEAAYAELIFSDKLWCDMDENDAYAILEEFARRNRKFGR